MYTGPRTTSGVGGKLGDMKSSMAASSRNTPSSTAGPGPVSSSHKSHVVTVTDVLEHLNVLLGRLPTFEGHCRPKVFGWDQDCRSSRPDPRLLADVLRAPRQEFGKGPSSFLAYAATPSRRHLQYAQGSPGQRSAIAVVLVFLTMLALSRGL